MIENFDCDSFRNVSCNDLQFRRINILIGPNNSGKSNFIHALSFAADMIKPRLAEQNHFLAALRRNGWNRMLDRRDKSAKQNFEIAWKFKLKQNRSVLYKINVHLGDRPEDDYFLEESLNSAEAATDKTNPYNYFSCHKRNRGVGEFSTAGATSRPNRRIKAPVDCNETVLMQIDDLFFKNKEMFSSPFLRDEIRDVLASLREYFRGFFSYSCTAFNIDAVRSPQERQNDGWTLGRDGSNFINVYRSLCETDKTFYARFSLMLKRMIVGFEKIEVEEIGDRILMNFSINGTWYSLAELSDGTVHLVLLLLLLSLPEERRPTMLALDEPEMNLHPAWQKILASEILRTKGSGQFFISTHSPDFLDEFTEGFMQDEVALIVFDPRMRNEIHNLDKKDFEGDLGEFTLGDLYRVGDPLIGGWPQ